VHHIHTTDGLIIYSRAQGEANKLVYIFTRDLGLIIAIAQGIRLEKSKLRYHIHDYRISRFSLVQGKEFWRIVGATEIEGDKLPISESYYSIFIPISSMLKRLVQGQEVHPEIFECLENCADFINKISDRKTETISTIESLLLIRILFRLGYVGDRHSVLGEFLNNSIFSIDIVNDLIPKRVEINKIINNALRESQL
jgi:DNA repair protein RecO